MNTLQERSEVTMLVGTPKEIQLRLDKSHAQQIVAVSIGQVGNSEAVQFMAENLQTILSTMSEALKERQEKQTLELLIDALSRKEPVAPHLLKEAAMLAKARKAVISSGDWLTAVEVAEIAQLSAKNPSSQPNKWKKQGLIFAIQYKGQDYFPAYGLDPDNNFRPVKAMAQVIEVFKEHKDSWGMAFWFMSDNSFLGGQRPQDLLVDAPERVIAAAQDDIEGITHG